jgi:asparagine synthase (glutamine-hydrolysing)
MCGIYGLLGADARQPADTDLLRRMNDVLVHRGPDGGGVYSDGPLGMGMRRLSIIDLATGDQPMANEDGSVWVVFNGEIYNYREVRKDLAARGHTFRTASDTEVLVHLWEEDGEACVQRLRGMFAFAIWDRSTATLFLARDRVGIKPLFYAPTADGIVFGSELKALTLSPWVERRVDLIAVSAYLAYGYVPDPHTILETVVKLPPGHTLTVREGRAGTARPYWTPTPFFRGPMGPRREEDAMAALDTLLQDAVHSHLVSDVPVGAFLSGGVDSSAMVALMAHETGARVKTFSVGFDEDAISELPYARQVAKWCGTEHFELRVGAGDIHVLEDVLSAVDEPFADSSSIPTFLVSRLARQHVKVVMSGDGGDEIFAGYDRYRVDHRRRHLGWLADAGFGGGLKRLSDALPEGTRGKNLLFNMSLPRMERYLDAIALFPHRALDALMEPGTRRFSFNGALTAGARLDPLSRLQDFDLQTYLPGDILTKVDRMTMANSLEARVPFLDHPLIEFACALPPALRMRGSTTKYLLRRALAGRVPPVVLTRRKQGFGPPLQAWFSGRLSGFFHDMLGDGTRLAPIGARPSAVRALVARYAERHRPEYCHRLWGLVVLDRALQRLMDRSSARACAAEMVS